MKIKDVMTRTVNTVEPTEPLQGVARIMRDHDLGAVPVVEHDKLIGMVTDRDIVIRALADGPDLGRSTAKDVMSPKMLYCREGQEVPEVLANMKQVQVRRLAVVDDDKKLVGVVSLGDLAKHAPAKDTRAALAGISR